MTPMNARIGMPVDSTEGVWGELDDFVVDPSTWHLTHLIVQPHHHHDRSRLIAVEDVAECDTRITLALSPAEIEGSLQVEVTDFVEVETPRTFKNDWSSDASRASAWPYYPYTGTLFGLGGVGFLSGHSSAEDEPRYVATKIDHIPAHEIEIRRSSHVISRDGHKVGSVDGFVFDGTGTITHLVLDHGHLWGRREITIPIVHVRGATGERVRLDVTSDEIGEFPSIQFHHPERATA